MTESNIEKETSHISKSQRKRDAHQLFGLAKILVEMPATRLRDIPLDEDLGTAIQFARGIRAHGARKRQLQTIAKMLRNCDADPINEAVNNIDLKDRQMIARHHRIEAWRDRLIRGSDHELGTLLKYCPDINVQSLRQCIRNAKKETALAKPPAAARKLFKLLRETDKLTPLPPIPGN